MSFLVPAHLMLDATRAVAWSALPNAPVEPDPPPRWRRTRALLRALLRRPAIDDCSAVDPSADH